jgi:hypothetical protein
MHTNEVLADVRVLLDHLQNEVKSMKENSTGNSPNSANSAVSTDGVVSPNGENHSIRKPDSYYLLMDRVTFCNALAATVSGLFAIFTRY